MKLSMRRGILAIFLAGLVAVIAGGIAVRAHAARQPVTLTFTSFDYPGAKSTYATAINNAGVIVGYYTDASNNYYGFTYTGSTFTSLSFTGFVNTQIWGINDSGEVVGFYTIEMNEIVYTLGFSYTSSGGFVTVAYPGAVVTSAYGINNAGEIVGIWVDDALNTHGFTLVSGVYTSFDYPGSKITYAYGINNAGEISGLTIDGCCVFNGFTLTGGIGGTFTEISYPGGKEDSTGVLKINDNAQLVGYFYPTKGVGVRGFANAGSRYASFVDSGSPTEATGINNAANIVGAYGTSEVTHGFLAVPSTQ